MMQMAQQSPQDIYRIYGSEADWHVEMNERSGMSYASKEAAFEAAVAAASNAIRDGHEVIILVPGAEPGEAALGVEDSGGVSPPSPT